MTEDTAHWPSGTVRIVWHGAEELELPLTGAHGFCFHHGKVLVCDIPGRGFTIPGGHIERDESAVACLTREASEEACVGLANLTLIGFIEADHRANSDFDGRYPLRSVQAIYRADVAKVGEFDLENESTDRKFVTIGELPSVHHEWNAVLQRALEAAAKTGDHRMLSGQSGRASVRLRLKE
jgi:ADP-ribose pyrophosphatase YjhB (NUDIX family)